MDQNLLKKYIIRWNSANLAFIIVIMFTILYYLFAIASGIPFNFMFAVPFLILYIVAFLLFRKDKKFGLIFAAIIMIIDGITMLIYFDTSIMFGLFIKVCLIISFFQALPSIGNIPENVDISATIKNIRKNLKERKANGTFDKEEYRALRKKGSFYGDIIYKDS